MPPAGLAQNSDWSGHSKGPLYSPSFLGAGTGWKADEWRFWSAHSPAPRFQPSTPEAVGTAPGHKACSSRAASRGSWTKTDGCTHSFHSLHAPRCRRPDAGGSPGHSWLSTGGEDKSAGVKQQGHSRQEVRVTAALSPSMHPHESGSSKSKSFLKQKHFKGPYDMKKYVELFSILYMWHIQFIH